MVRWKRRVAGMLVAVCAGATILQFAVAMTRFEGPLSRFGEPLPRFGEPLPSIADTHLLRRVAEGMEPLTQLVPRPGHHTQQTMPLAMAMATQLVRDAVADSSASPGRAKVTLRGPLLAYAMRMVLAAPLETQDAASDTELSQRTDAPALRMLRAGADRNRQTHTNLRASMQVRRQPDSDTSTGRGMIGVGFVRVPVTARVDDATNTILVQLATAREYRGSAAGIALDAGRELLEHHDLWQTTDATCTSEPSRTCTIRVRVLPDALRRQLTREPAGELTRALRSIALMDGTVTIQGHTLTADEWTIADAAGRHLRISSTYM